jgi:hypothetical protein
MTSSSIIVMPQVNPVEDTATDAVVAASVSSRPASPVTAPLTATEDGDAVSEYGSEASSVSLISVPTSASSEDDVQDALWEDSRASVHVEPVGDNRDEGEYVVLYDDSTSDDEE